MDVPLALRECLEYVIGSLIDHRDQVSITQNEEGGRLVFTVVLHPDDVRHLLGRQGHTIKALRNVMAAAASREGLRVAVRVDGFDEEDAEEDKKRSGTAGGKSQIPNPKSETNSNEL
jgi:predicted RNA-binding protein YlqC (UPF0109 family)